MGTMIRKFCSTCCRTHAFIEGRNTCKKVIRMDVSDDTHESALGKIGIAKEVARTEGNRLPGGTSNG